MIGRTEFENRMEAKGINKECLRKVLDVIENISYSDIIKAERKRAKNIECNKSEIIK